MKEFTLLLYYIIKLILSIIYSVAAIATAMIGYTMTHSIFWSIVNFFLMPISWVYWLVTKQINISIIKETFAFFFK